MDPMVPTIYPPTTANAKSDAHSPASGDATTDLTHTLDQLETLSIRSSDSVDSAGSYDSEEPEPLELDLDALKIIANTIITDHGRCVGVRKLTRGTYHEIFLCSFSDEWSCIARVPRRSESLDKARSEVAIMRYVREHTDIPVPEIFYCDLDSDNPVGAAFVFMERMRGRHLYKTWYDMTMEHKSLAISQITEVLGQLASLKFTCIGTLQAGGLGPLICPSYGENSQGPFETTEDFLFSFMDEGVVEMAELKQVFRDIKDVLRELLKSDSKVDRDQVSETNKTRAADDTASNPIAKSTQQVVPSETGSANPESTHHLTEHLNHAAASLELLDRPYRLIHEDLDAQNMLFVQTDAGPVLSGIIDWDYSFVGPAYYLYEYPIFIQDVHWSEHLYAENKILRKHFVRSLAQQFPKGSEERKCVHHCMRHKSFVWNNFADVFMNGQNDESDLLEAAKQYLEDLKSGNGRPYEGRLDWGPDSELESDDEDISEETN